MKPSSKSVWRTALVLLLVVVCAIVGVSIVRQSHPLAKSSAAARWWRCVGVERPLLADSGKPWMLKYSWKGDEGPGSVTFTLRDDGHAVLEAVSQSNHVVRQQTHLLPQAEVESIAAVIDGTGLLCLETVRRQNHVVDDLGTYSIELSSDSYRKSLQIDRCHTVSDASAATDFIIRIRELAESTSPELAWGPFGVSSKPGKCD